MIGDTAISLIRNRVQWTENGQTNLESGSTDAFTFWIFWTKMRRLSVFNPPQTLPESAALSVHCVAKPK